MGWFDAIVETAGDVAGAIPGISEVASAGMTAYHGTSALMNYIGGDDELAQDELMATGNSAVGLIPAVGEGYHAVHAGANIAALGARAFGASEEEAPTVSEAMADVVFGRE